MIKKGSKNIKLVAITDANGVVKCPKKIYFANSNNSVFLVYKRYGLDLHCINFNPFERFGVASQITEIILTNNVSLKENAYNNTIIDITYGNHFPTYEFLIKNENTNTYKWYIANYFYGESSKIYLYGNCDSAFRQLEQVSNFDITSKIDTHNVTNMRLMFDNCKIATNLDVSDWDVSNVTDMSMMFRQVLCATIDVSKWNVSNVKSIAGMFQYVSSDLDLSTFNTLKTNDWGSIFYRTTFKNLKMPKSISITNMYRFISNSEIEKIDLTDISFNDCTSFKEAFASCPKLTQLILPQTFVTSRCSDLSSMFYNCRSIVELDCSNFNTSNVNIMGSMFANCTSLKHLDISNFNTSNVTNMSSMFLQCTSLKHLDISNFNTSKVTTLYRFVDLNNALITLNLGKNFNTNNVLNMDFFCRCNKLKTIVSCSFVNYPPNAAGPLSVPQVIGGSGSIYVSSDLQYARIDNPPDIGYFTDPDSVAKLTLVNMDNTDNIDYDYIKLNTNYTISLLSGYTAVVTDNNSNTYSDGDTITITENLTLTFVWTANN